MGSNDFYPEERPIHHVTVDGFWMDEHPVTSAEFRRFVKATGYVTVAERSPNPSDYPDADPALLIPGSLVFRRPPRADAEHRSIERGYGEDELTRASAFRVYRDPADLHRSLDEVGVLP